MATQAFPYLVITDGTTTLTIADGSGGATVYSLEADTGAWNPAIGGLSQGQLGGRGPYDDVLETMKLNISGANAAAVYSNLQTLERLIDQSERWSRGENVSIVLIKFAPQGSTVASTAAPLQAVIMGYAPNATAACTSGNKMLLMPSAAGSSFILPGVQLRFMRRAAWLLSAAVTDTTASIANPGPYLTNAIATHPNISPAKLTLAGFTASTAIDTVDSKPIVLIARLNSDLQIAEAESGTVAVTFVSTADATNVARGGSHIRYNPLVTTEALGGEIAFGSITASARRFAFFAAIRNNSVTTTWKVRIGALIRTRAAGSVNEIVAYTRPVVIGTPHTRPQFVPLGVVSLPDQLRSVQLAITASASAGTLDIDYVVALAVDNPYARALQLDKIEGTGAYPHVSVADLVIDPRPLTALAPLVYRTFETTSDNDYMGYFGDAYPVADRTEFTSAIMCKRADVPASWTYAPASGAAVGLTATVARQNAYLVPE